jgi:hypothetical protein
MSYQSQAESRYDRALRRARKLRARLGAHDGIGEFIPRPKGMRSRTFNRIADEIERVEATADSHLSSVLLRLDPELAKRFGYR